MEETLCWRCSRIYDPRQAECPHCEATNANHDPARAMREATKDVEFAEPETTYEKSARWAWPDGRPDL